MVIWWQTFVQHIIENTHTPNSCFGFSSRAFRRRRSTKNYLNGDALSRAYLQINRKIAKHHLGRQRRRQRRRVRFARNNARATWRPMLNVCCADIEFAYMQNRRIRFGPIALLHTQRAHQRQRAYNQLQCSKHATRTSLAMQPALMPAHWGNHQTTQHRTNLCDLECWWWWCARWDSGCREKKKLPCERGLNGIQYSNLYVEGRGEKFTSRTIDKNTEMYPGIKIHTHIDNGACILELLPGSSTTWWPTFPYVGRGLVCERRVYICLYLRQTARN